MTSTHPVSTLEAAHELLEGAAASIRRTEATLRGRERQHAARSDYHWQCDSTYDECRRRGMLKMYDEEFAAVRRQECGR